MKRAEDLLFGYMNIKGQVLNKSLKIFLLKRRKRERILGQTWDLEIELSTKISGEDEE